MDPCAVPDPNLSPKFWDRALLEALGALGGPRVPKKKRKNVALCPPWGPMGPYVGQRARSALYAFPWKAALAPLADPAPPFRAALAVARAALSAI